MTLLLHCVCVQDDNGPERVYKVISVGNSAVGKTSIIRRLVNGNFTLNTATTLGMDVMIKPVKTEKGTAVLQLWDTAGQEKYLLPNLPFSFFKSPAQIKLLDLKR